MKEEIENNSAVTGDRKTRFMANGGCRLRACVFSAAKSYVTANLPSGEQQAFLFFFLTLTHRALQSFHLGLETDKIHAGQNNNAPAMLLVAK